MQTTPSCVFFSCFETVGEESGYQGRIPLGYTALLKNVGHMETGVLGKKKKNLGKFIIPVVRRLHCKSVSNFIFFSNIT